MSIESIYEEGTYLHGYECRCARCLRPLVSPAGYDQEWIDGQLQDVPLCERCYTNLNHLEDD
jgi:hypothetical protein